jgi:hypothetical protein
MQQSCPSRQAAPTLHSTVRELPCEMHGAFASLCVEYRSIHTAGNNRTRHRFGGVGEAGEELGARTVAACEEPAGKPFPRFALGETTPIMATTVGPARDKADNSANRGLIADSVWLPVCRFHVGTNAERFTSDAGYTTATDFRVDQHSTAFLLFRGRSPHRKG